MPGTTLGPVNIKLSGGTYVKGAKQDHVKLTFIGVSPNATVKLYLWDDRRKRFDEFDKLTEAVIEEDPDDATKMRIIGKSEMAQELIGHSDADLMVRWDVVVKGSCEDCSG